MLERTIERVAAGAVRRPAAVIVLCALAAYAAVLLGTFVYDDVHTARDNPAIRSLANLPRFFVDLDMFSAVECRMYRPAVLVTYAVDWFVGGGAAWPFKATNLALHAATALALHALLRALGAAPSTALFAACLFVVHPLASEAVNTISGRSELLVTLGIVGGVLAHLRARQRPVWSFATAACATLACGSKEIGVVLPALLLVLDPPALRTSVAWPRWLGRHALPALVVFGYLIVRRVLFGHATAPLPALSGGETPMAGHGRDLVTQLCTMATLLPRALAQCVLPLGLSLDPPVQFVRSPGSPRVVCGVLFVAALTYLGLRAARRSLLARLGIAFAWATALPWVLLPLNLPYLEHRMYAPLAGLSLVLAGVRTGSRTGAASTRGWGDPPAVSPRLARAAAVALLGVFALLASGRSLEFRDATRMWRDVVAAQSGSVRGLCGLAVCYMEAGDLEEALPLVRRAVALWPDHAVALRNLAELELKLAPAPGNAMAALVAAERLCELSPNDPFDCLLRSRALALAAEHTAYEPFYDEAEAEALRCLAIAPPKALVYRTAASARTRQGKHARALELLDLAVAAGFDSAPLRLDRVDALRRLGRTAEADAALHAVLRDHPFDPAVLQMVSTRLGAPPR